MKYRNGLVSNSSSSSFIIKRARLSDDQVSKIENHLEYWNEFIAELPGYDSCSDDYGWHINVSSEFVSGSTFMDNFSMDELFDFIGVDENAIEWTN